MGIQFLVEAILKALGLQVSPEQLTEAYNKATTAIPQLAEDFAALNRKVDRLLEINDPKPVRFTCERCMRIVAIGESVKIFTDNDKRDYLAHTEECRLEVSNVA